VERLPSAGVTALGITWILDGLEVTLAGSVAAALQTSPRLHLTAEQVGLTGSAYLMGAVLGSLYFGHLTDRLGRKKLFNVTLGVYLAADRGDGVVVELRELPVLPLPDRRGHRRRVFGDQLGDPGADPGPPARPHRPRDQRQLLARRRVRRAGLGAACSIPALFGADWGWRIAFGSGAVLGLFILYLRRFLPESPRWLMLHGRPARRAR
jgi:MFS family permease